MRRKHDWIKDFCLEAAPRTESPERFLYWSAVSAVAGAVRRRCYIEMGTFRWFPNFYIIFVGPPGIVKKSTTIDLSISCLRQLPSVHFGSDSVTWERFVDEIDKAQDNFVIQNGTTSIMEQEFAQTRAITYAISEFGTFFDPKNLPLVNMLTEFWDCKDAPFKKGTKTQGDNIITAPFVNLIAGTTPDWIGMNFKTHFGGWGLSSRIIFIHASKMERQVPFPDELWGDRMLTWKDDFAHDLGEIEKMQGAFTIPEETRVLARASYAKISARQESMARHPNSDPWMSYYLARKYTHIMKLALVLSISQGESYRIEPEHFKEAEMRCTAIEDEIGVIFNGKRRKASQQELYLDVARGIANGIDKYGPRPEVMIAQFGFQWMDGNQLKTLLNQMISCRYIFRAEEDGQAIIHLTDAGRQFLLPGEGEAHSAADPAGDGLPSFDPSGDGFASGLLGDISC
jgi:hypothetical protein